MSWANMPEEGAPNPPPAIPAAGGAAPVEAQPPQHDPYAAPQGHQAPSAHPGHQAPQGYQGHQAPQAPHEPYAAPGGYHGGGHGGYAPPGQGYEQPGYAYPAPAPGQYRNPPVQPGYGGHYPAPGYGGGYGHYQAPPIYSAPGDSSSSVPLSSEIAHSDPRNPDHQMMLLTRIRELSAMVPPDESQLEVNLNMASMLTQYLIRMGGIGPEDVLQIVSRLVNEVELAATKVSAQPQASSRPQRVVLDSQPSSGGLHLVGQSGAGSGRLLGELMVQLGFCTRAEVDAALRTQKAAGVRLGEALVSSGAATWAQVKQAITAQSRK